MTESQREDSASAVSGRFCHAGYPPSEVRKPLGRSLVKFVPSEDEHEAALPAGSGTSCRRKCYGQE